MSRSGFLVTTSWDDGYPADRRIADLLSKYGIAGTFYVPSRNVEGRPVMSREDVAALARQFEVGGHTRDHVVLTTLTQREVVTQVTDNKSWLEDILGRPVPGFCYVRGRYNSQIMAAVCQAGYVYARTVRNLSINSGADPLQMATTLQFFDHSPYVYLKNFVSGGPSPARARILASVLAPGDLATRVTRLAQLCADAGGCCHIWGHSWEIEAFDLWNALDLALRSVSKIDGFETMTNHNMLRKTGVLPRLDSPNSVLPPSAA